MRCERVPLGYGIAYAHFPRLDLGVIKNYCVRTDVNQLYAVPMLIMNSLRGRVHRCSLT